MIIDVWTKCNFNFLINFFKVLNNVLNKFNENYFSIFVQVDGKIDLGRPQAGDAVLVKTQGKLRDGTIVDDNPVKDISIKTKLCYSSGKAERWNISRRQPGKGHFNQNNILGLLNYGAIVEDNPVKDISIKTKLCYSSGKAERWNNSRWQPGKGHFNQNTILLSLHYGTKVD